MINVLRNTIIVAFVMLALVALAANIPLPQGYRLLVVQTGSMEPAMPVGSVVLTRSSADFAAPMPMTRFLVGDIITYEAGRNNFVSHRVVEIVERNGQFFYRTKGDANKKADQKLIAEKDVMGEVFLTAPYVGRFVNFTKEPIGYFLMILIPSLYVILSEVWVFISELRRTRIKPPTLSGQSATLSVALLIAVSSFYFVAGTAAYFSDTANSTNNIFTTAEFFSSVPLECADIELARDPISGTSAGDHLNGTVGNDLIFGLEGSDTINGNGGDDCIVGGAGNDSLTGNNGSDVIFGEVGSDSLKGNNGQDRLVGGEGSDSLDGGNQNDILKGDQGSDFLKGGAGDDDLDGGLGSDALNGGPDIDMCVNGESNQNCEN
ncbi:MAG: signal peptidase I [Candidatus Woykebacteria bacterium]